MTMHFLKGRYVARFASGQADVEACQALRYRRFIADVPGLDRDRFDLMCQHMMIEDGEGRLVCTFRLMLLDSGAKIDLSYAAQHYDLMGLSSFERPLLEMGRFCVDPTCNDGDVLRVAWGALTKFVDESGVEMLFGCSSFAGDTDHAEVFDILRCRHLAPQKWMPAMKAPEIVKFPELLHPDRRAAMRAMPPLLKTYLSMGGWVSDHAVVDRELGTLHVFTGLEIAVIPPNRVRALRAMAG